MIIKIHQACSIKNALFYNERKVERHFAFFYQSRNTPEMNPFLGDKNARYGIFKEIECRNTRVRKPGLRISVNPTVSDLIRLGDTGIRTEIGNLMKHLGYENQPYLVYKHADLERIHFHIVPVLIVIPAKRSLTVTRKKGHSGLLKIWSKNTNLPKMNHRRNSTTGFPGPAKT